MNWKLLEEIHVHSLEWGCVLRNGLYHPVYTEQPAASADLLKFIRCKSKISSKSPCSANCSCKKKRTIYCVAACE